MEASTLIRAGIAGLSAERQRKLLGGNAASLFF
jgi:hypothetical protein